MKTTKNLNFTKKMLSYSLTSALVVAGGQDINGEIAYYDIEDETVGSNGSYEVDINNDGTPDFTISQNHSESTSTYSSYSNLFDSVRIDGSQSQNKILKSSSSSYAQLMNTGDVVGLSTTYSSYNTQEFINNVQLGYYAYSYGSSYTYGSWEGEEGYLGVKFDINGNNHYGWIRLEVFSYYSGFTVRDFAYETIPDYEIETGWNQKPTIDERKMALDLSKYFANVSIPDNDSFNFAEAPFTIETWIKNTNPNTRDGEIRIISKAKTDMTNGYSLCLSSNKLALQLTSLESSESAILTAGPEIQNDGMWHHVAAVRNSSGGILLYVDGVEYNTGESFPWSVDEDNSLLVGLLGTVPLTHYIGFIDEIRIWNIARTNEEIDNNRYNSLTGSETGLKAYYNFENNQNTLDVLDLSPNGNNGVITYGKFVGTGIPMVYEVEKNDSIQFVLHAKDKNTEETFVWSVLEQPRFGEITFPVIAASNDTMPVQYKPNDNMVGIDTLSIKVATSDNLFDELKIIVNVIESSNIANNNLPLTTKLYQNYPNPFNPVTTIKYDISRETFVELSIYNQRGQLTRTLIKEKMKAGNHKVVWDSKDNYGSTVTSGMYIYQLRTGNHVKVLKAVLVK